MKEREYFSPSTLRVCIDRIDGYQIYGRVYCRMQKDAISFHDINELLLKVDLLFEEKGFPQSFQEKKEFGQREIKESFSYCYRPELFLTEEEIRSFHGEVRTVNLVIQSRRHTSWQGFVIENGQMIGGFDGEIGLLKYFDPSGPDTFPWKMA